MRLHLRGRAKRGGALLVVAALALTSGVTFLASPASAASVGTLTFSPATGLSTTPINLMTVSPGGSGCPAGTTNVKATANGPGWTNVPVVGNTSAGVSTTADFGVPFADTFAGIAQSNGLAITAGRYDISLICQNKFGNTVFGTFDSPIFFTDATHYQSNDPNQVAQTTTTTVTAAPASPQVTGTSVTFTATVSPSAAGSVQFKDGAANLGAAQAVSAGKATFATSSLAAGSHSISGVFTPTDSSAFKASTSAVLTYVISPPAATTTTTVVTAAPASPQVAGTSVTFTATVSPSAAGTVQFKDGASNLGTAQTVSAGKATLATTALAAGSHTITGVFTPTDPTAFTGSTSTAITYVISAAAQTTTTTVTAAPASPQLSGTSVTFTATVSPSAAGTVQFKDGASNLGTPQTVSASKAALSTSALAIGSHTISAVFTPTDSAAFTGSTSPGITYVVSAPAATSTTTALSATPASPQVSGTSVSFTATVSPTAAGTVQFKDGSTNIGTPQTVSGGQASLATSSLTVGSHSVTATFVPTDPASFTGSTSPAITYVISPTPAQNTTTVVSASPASPALSGVSVAFTATISPAAAGTVQFKDAGTNLGSPATVSGTTATVTTNTLSVGSHSITAVFTPTDPAAFNGSTSAALPFVVNQSPAQTTSTALSASPASPVVVGTSVTFTATVSPAAAGTVQFKDGTANLGSPATVSGGQASTSTSALTAGSHSVTAVFTPTDPTAFTGRPQRRPPSWSPQRRPPPTTALSANPASPVSTGTAVTFTATVSPAAAGTVQFKDGSTDLGTLQTVSGGQATTSTSTLAAGSHSITAVFVPTDATAFTGSTSPAVTFVVNGPTNTNLGTLTFLPATGQDTTPIQIFTHSTGAAPGCPASATNVRASVNGPTGWTNIPVVGNTGAGVSTTADFSVPMADTFIGIATSNGLKLVAGEYDFTLFCQNRLGTTVFGTFTGSLFFTDATHFQSTNPTNTTTTTTTALAVSPFARQDLGKPVTLTGSVTPAGAVGAIQFTDTVSGVTVNLGGPNTVAGGTAKVVISSLAFGLHTFAAKFVPTDATKFTASTSSSVVYVVALPAPPKLIRGAKISGSGHLGSSLTCSATFSGATSVAYTWLRNGRVISGADNSTYRLGNADRLTMISCRVTAKNVGGSTPTTSRAVFVGLFGFRLVGPPFIFGAHKVGSWLLAYPGNWQPSPSSYSYQWLRDGEAIKGASKQIYKVTSADSKHKLSVQASVSMLFYYPAVAVSRSV